ncbi:hypothetical protein L9F63_010165, partial [Diploptera punctata]
WRKNTQINLKDCLNVRKSYSIYSCLVSNIQMLSVDQKILQLLRLLTLRIFYIQSSDKLYAVLGEMTEILRTGVVCKYITLYSNYFQSLLNSL